MVKNQAHSPTSYHIPYVVGFQTICQDGDYHLIIPNGINYLALSPNSGKGVSTFTGIA